MVLEEYKYVVKEKKADKFIIEIEIPSDESDKKIRLTYKLF